MDSSLQKLILLLTLILVLSGCPLITGPPDDKEALATAQGTGGWNGGDGGDGGNEDGDGGGAVELPPSDVVRDSFRVYSSDFKFETLLPVELDLTVRADEKSDDGVYPPLSQIVVTLFDEEGEILSRGLTDGDGLLESTVMMASAPENVTLELATAAGPVKSIEVRDAVKRSRIERIIYLDAGGADGLAASATAPDTDGDGVVDAYDLFPDDPDRAFAYDSSLLTVAFEDLYLQASAGDADYNDFVGQYQVTVETNAEGLVTGLTGEAYAKTKIAGYNHDFGIFLEFNGTGELSYSQTNGSGSTVRQVNGERVEDGEAYILLFESTKDSLGHSATFDLDFDDPIAPEEVDRAPYDPFLYVRNTRYDIHLIGEDPLPPPYSERTGTGEFQDAEGFPWALLVPGDWINPGEGVRIENVYPAFDYWRSSFGEDYPDWYEYYQVDPGPPVDEPVVYVAGYYNDGSKDVAAYWTDDAGTITRHDLYPSGLSEATDIAVEEDGTVHAVGYLRRDRTDVAAYWSDGNTVELESPGRATGVAIGDSGTVIISGYHINGSRDVATYWTYDGVSVTPYRLEGELESSATDVVVGNNGDRYFSGYFD
ncbi:MAG: LruC domain-containing protein, partial [Spirochaetaceae bacterium]